MPQIKTKLKNEKNKLTEESSNKRMFKTSNAQQLSARSPDRNAIITRQASTGATSVRVNFRRLYNNGVTASTLSEGNVISLFGAGC